MASSPERCCHLHPDRARLARREPPSARVGVRRHRFHPSPARIAGRDLARSVRRVLLGSERRCCPIYRPRHPVSPARGAWACCAPRRRSGRSRLRSGFARYPIQRHAGRQNARSGRAVLWARDDRVRLSRSLPPSMAGADRARRVDMFSVVVRQSLMQLAPRTRCAAASPRRQLDVHRRVESARRVRVGGDGGVVRRRAGSVVLGGLGSLLIVALWLRLFPQLRRGRCARGGTPGAWQAPEPRPLRLQ